LQTARQLLRATLEAKLSGRYRIDQELGFGGMAVVYKAENLELGRPVALKVLRPDRILDPEIAQRFRTEALAIARLTHPHIVAIHARGEDPDLMWFEMDYIDGGTLQDLFAMGPVEWPRLLRLLAQAASALASAHAMGVIHRDIKPSNMMLAGSQDHLVMTDFGIAKILGRTTLTETGVTLGTVAYMSPEQLMAQEVTGATDQYSLGVVAYEGLMGRQPFAAEGTGPAALERLRVPIASLLTERPELPSDVNLLVQRMLAPDPADRWADLKAVQRIAEEIAVSGQSHYMHGTGVTRRQRSQRRGLVVAGATTLGLLVLATTQLGNREPDPVVPPPIDGQLTVGGSILSDSTVRIPVPVPPPPAAPASEPRRPPASSEERRRVNRDTQAFEGTPQGGPDSTVQTPSGVEDPPVPPTRTTGTLRIASPVAGTFVYINGSATPHFLRAEFQDIEVPAGRVTLTLVNNRPGCQVREDVVTVDAGQVRSLRRSADCPDD